MCACVFMPYSQDCKYPYIIIFRLVIEMGAYRPPAVHERMGVAVQLGSHI